MKQPNTGEAKSTISVGITWVDLRILFGPDHKLAPFWVGVCHYTDRVYMWSPVDFQKPLMVTTIHVSPTENYCSVAHECLNFKCPLNRFTKEVFFHKFEDIGRGNLGLPNNFGEEDVWMNDPNLKWHTIWGKLINSMKPEGGRLVFSQEDWEKTE